MNPETLRQRKKFTLELAQRGDRMAEKPAKRRGRNALPPDIIPQPKGSGLATWRKQQAEDKRERMAELERLREDATTEVREGRTFTLVHIPDLYDWGAP